MNHNTPFRFKGTIVLALVLAGAIVYSAGWASAATAMGVPGSPPRFSEAADGSQRGLPCQPTCGPGVSDALLSGGAAATSISRPAPALGDAGVQGTPLVTNPDVEVRRVFNWADAGIGAGFAIGLLVLGGGALILALRHRKPSIPVV
jgi:hypothetical protein